MHRSMPAFCRSCKLGFTEKASIQPSQADVRELHALKGAGAVIVALP